MLVTHKSLPIPSIWLHRERGSCNCQLSLLKGNSSGAVGADRIPTSGSHRLLNPTADCFTGCYLVRNLISFNKSSSSFLLVKVYAIDPSNEFLIQSRIFSATSRNIRVAGFMAACSVCRPVKASWSPRGLTPSLALLQRARWASVAPVTWMCFFLQNMPEGSGGIFVYHWNNCLKSQGFLGERYLYV